MAKTKSAPVKENGKNTKTVQKSSSVDELSALAASNREMEAIERAKAGSNLSFISLATPRSTALDKNAPSFIKGAKPFDYVIPGKKINLGAKLDATILGMFKVYSEVTPKRKEGEMAKTIQFWMPDDAIQFPIMMGSYFDRELPSGNLLQPGHWVFLYLHDHPEIDDGLISFRSVGNTFYKELEKLVKAESEVCTELRFSITYREKYNDSYKKTDYYPKFELTGHNYKYVDGKVTKTKDSKVDKDELKEILSRSNQLQQDYQNMRMVFKKNLTALIGSSKPALPAGKTGYAKEEDEAVNF